MKHYFLSQDWLATVHEVLQADWQEARQFPQPPCLTESFSMGPQIVLIFFSVVVFIFYLLSARQVVAPYSVVN